MHEVRAEKMEIGIKGERTLVVTKELLANQVGSGLVAVFATPMMIANIEGTAADSVAPSLDAGKTTVGTLVNVTHVAATPEVLRAASIWMPHARPRATAFTIWQVTLHVCIRPSCPTRAIL